MQRIGRDRATGNVERIQHRRHGLDLIRALSLIASVHRQRADIFLDVAVFAVVSHRTHHVHLLPFIVHNYAANRLAVHRDTFVRITVSGYVRQFL